MAVTLSARLEQRRSFGVEQVVQITSAIWSLRQKNVGLSLIDADH